MLLRSSILFFLLLALCSLRAQHADTLRTIHWSAPTAIAVSGVLIDRLGHDHLWQKRTHDLIGTTRSSIDDYLQFVPSAILGGLMISDNKTLKDHGWQYAVSTAATGVITYGMKRMINKRRPNGGSLAFPSGHTSFAFSTATVLYHGIKEKSPTLAYLSYLPALTVAGYRVARDKHWVSDVLVGAGLGILVTYLTYYWMPAKTSWHKEQSKISWRLKSTNNGLGLVVFF